MNQTLKLILVLILAVIVGMFLGAVANMALIMLSPYVISPPEGVNVENIESLRENIHLFEAKHYIMPFLAHALGTLVGAFVAVKICNIFKLPQIAGYAAFIIALLFLWGGISTSKMINSPLVPALVDALLAYIPFGWLGFKFGKK